MGALISFFLIDQDNKVKIEHGKFLFWVNWKIVMPISIKIKKSVKSELTEQRANLITEVVFLIWWIRVLTSRVMFRSKGQSAYLVEVSQFIDLKGFEKKNGSW